MTIILTLIIFGLIITLHELGHFFFAKLFGVRVFEFSFGMGPRLCGFRKGETEYSIRLFPIGGYVAMDGENGDLEEEDAPPKEPGRAFYEKAAWKRFLILAAGAGMNILLGFGLLGVLTSQQNLLGTTVIAKIEEGSPAAESLQPYDRITKVNGHKVSSYNDLVNQLVRDSDGIFEMEVLRGSDPHDSLFRQTGEKVQLSQVRFQTEEKEGQNVIRMDLTFYGVENSFLRGLQYAADWTVSSVKLVVYSLLDLVTGRYGISSLSGPVGTAVVIGEASSQGLKPFLMIFAFITINIGVMNLLPLPALDGGRLLFLLIEMVCGKPVPSKYEAWIHGAGLLFFLGLIVLVTFHDIFRLFHGGF